MKLSTFTFHFDGGSLTVRAFTYEQAKRFAQTESLARGWGYEVRGFDYETEDTIEVAIDELLEQAKREGAKEIIAEIRRVFKMHGVTYMLRRIEELEEECEVQCK